MLCDLIVLQVSRVTEKQTFVIPPAGGEESSGAGGEEPSRAGGEEPKLQAKTLRESLIHVRETLIEIAQLSEDVRKQVLKRLYLQWHPDKNPENQENAAVIFRYIRQAAEEGKLPPWPEECMPDPDHANTSQTTKNSTSSQSQGNPSSSRSHNHTSGGFGGFDFGGFGGGFDWKDTFRSWDRSSRRNHAYSGGTRRNNASADSADAFLFEDGVYVRLKRSGFHQGSLSFKRY